MGKEIKDNQLPSNQYLIVSTKNKKIGLWLLIAAQIMVLLPLLTVIIFTCINFSNENIHYYSNAIVYTNILITSDALMIVLWVVATIFLLRKESVVGLKFDERSGRGDKSEIPKEIDSKKYHWGAAILSVSWGIYNNVWISLIALLAFIPSSLIPFSGWLNAIGIICFVVLGFNGYKLAWQKQKWESVDKFLEEQKKWADWGTRFIAIVIISPILFIIVRFLMAWQSRYN
jgi:hypothetical protein